MKIIPQHSCVSVRSLSLALLGALALLAGYASPAAASPGALKILILESQCSPTETAASLRTEILAQPHVASVDFINGAEATPSDAELNPYDLVIAMGICGWKDATEVGNNLADYQDQGGVVVGATFDWEGTGAGYDLAGRWISTGYSPFEGGAPEVFGTATLGTHEASNPLLAGVSELSAYFRDKVSLTTGATQVAEWSDGTSAVAVKGDAVGINAYIGNEDGAEFSGDFARLIVNAAEILGRHTLTVTKAGTGAAQGTVTSAPAGISCGTICSANYPNGKSVTLTATTVGGGTVFNGWSGAGCSGTASCTLPMNAAQSVTATFTGAPPVPQPLPAKVTCTVPKLKGKKLKAAKTALLKAQCRLGKVKGKKSSSAKVKTQKPNPGTVLSAGSKVNVTVK